MTISLANGSEVSLSSSKFLKVYVNFKDQSKEIRHFQQGEAFSSQPTAAQTTMQEDFHANVDFFETEGHSGQFTFNTTPNSETSKIFGWLYHYQHDTITPILDSSAFFGITVVNQLSGEQIIGDAIRISQLPPNQGNGGAYALAWTLLCASYDNTWGAPADPMFS